MKNKPTGGIMKQLLVIKTSLFVSVVISSLKKHDILFNLVITVTVFFPHLFNHSSFYMTQKLILHISLLTIFFDLNL